MSATGGSIESVSLKGREFTVTSDADATKKLGGFEKEVQANGNGTARTVMTRVPWSIEGIVVEIDDTRGDQEFLQDIADDPEYVDCAMTLVDGTVYSARGTITGDIAASTMNVSAGITLSGTGRLGKQ